MTFQPIDNMDIGGVKVGYFAFDRFDTARTPQEEYRRAGDFVFHVFREGFRELDARDE